MTDPSAPWYTCSACQQRPCQCESMTDHEAYEHIQELVEEKRKLVMAMEQARKEAREAKAERDNLKSEPPDYLVLELDRAMRERDEWKAKAEQLEGDRGDYYQSFLEWMNTAFRFQRERNTLERENAALQDAVEHLRRQIDVLEAAQSLWEEAEAHKERCLLSGHYVFTQVRLGRNGYGYCPDHQRWHRVEAGA